MSAATIPGNGNRLIALFAAALLLRFGMVIFSGPSRSTFGDAAAYIRSARILLDTGTYPADVEPLPAFRAPGYPAFLAVSTLGHPDAVAADKLWNALLGALTVPLLAVLARSAFRSGQAAIATGAIAAVHPSFIMLAGDVQSESLFVLLVAGAALLLLGAWDRMRAAPALAAGGLLGFAALTRPAALLFFALLPLLLLVRGRPGRLRVAGAAVAGFVVLVFPWALRNRLAYGAWLPVSDQGGLVLYEGNSELNERFYQVHTRARYEQWTREATAEIDHGRIRALAGPPGTNPAVRSRALASAAIAWMRSDPGRTARLFLHKAADWIRPWPSPLVWSLPVVIAVGVYNSALCVAAVLGLWSSPRRGVAAAALLVLAVTMAAHVVLQTVWRYRIAYWDPVLVLFAGWGSVRLLARFRVPARVFENRPKGPAA
jgi:4-amino-4-deoxy-L-arabinose transferase-like glycosyltransferase